MISARDKRREKVAYEINRSTFARQEPPLPRDLPVQFLLGSCGGGSIKQNGNYAAACCTNPPVS